MLDAGANFWSRVRSQSATFSWVLGGKFTVVGANAALTLVLANVVAVETYGLVIAAIGCQLLVSRILLLGADTGVIRLGTLPESGRLAADMGRAGLVVVAATTAVCVVALLAMTPFWPWRNISPVWVAVILGGALGTALIDYGHHYRLARLDFRGASILLANAASVRATFTILAAVVFGGQTGATIAAYCGVSLVAGTLQASAIVRNTTARPTRAAVWRLVRYSSWLGAADVVVIMSLYEGTFLLLHAARPVDASVFGFALTLSLAFFALYNAFYEYVLARVVHVTSAKDLRTFARRSCVMSLALLLLCVPIIVVVAFVTPSLVRGDLVSAVPVFCVLAVSMLVLIIQAPFEAVCHAFVRPDLILVGWVLRVIVTAALVLHQSGEAGAMSTAVAQLVSGVFAAAVLIGVVVTRFRPNEAAAGAS